MSLAIMQPYLFPYIGYWQLINAADRFVILDDVNYIKKGWINRNRILINGQPAYFTISLEGASQNKRICDLSIQKPQAWRDKMLKSIDVTYRRAPFFAEAFPEIEKQLCRDEANLADFLSHHLHDMTQLLGIDTVLVRSSEIYANDDLRGQDRIIDICRRERAETYINPPGGRDLYDPQSFEEAAIDLRFLEGSAPSYPQRSSEFVPNLSIVDILMETGIEGTRAMLDSFELCRAKNQ